MLLKTFSSINESPISAEGFHSTNLSCPNMGFFLTYLIKYYKDRLYKMIIHMIGNLTILGSPITFVNKIGSGFKDFV
jgi:hypothetical protein